MNRQQKIRDWLATQDRPRTSREIADAIGGDVIKVQWSVGVLLRDGMLVRVKASKPCTYALGRPKQSQAEINDAAANGRRRAIARGVVFGGWSQDRIEAARLARREREAIKREAARQRAEERRKATAEAAAQRIATLRRERLTRQIRVRVAKVEQVAPSVPAQSVEEFLARGGQVQRLAAHEVSRKTLRFNYSEAA